VRQLDRTIIVRTIVAGWLVSYYQGTLWSETDTLKQEGEKGSYGHTEITRVEPQVAPAPGEGILRSHSEE